MENQVNLHAPGGRHITNHESVAGALGIPEFMPPNRRRIFKVNLHEPGGGHITNHESVAGALGIPELRSPDGDGTFKVNRQKTKAGL